MTEKKKNKIEVDLLQLVKALWADKKMSILFCFLGAIFGLIIAFSIPRVYKSSVMLAPEASNSSNLASGISSLAEMVGMDMDFGKSSDAIYPEIYPDLMKSTDFLVSLFPVNVKSYDDKINTTYYDYLKKNQKIAWWSYPKAWLIKTIRKMQEKGQKGKSSDKVNPFMLTRDQYDVAMAINNKVNCSVDKKTSVITIEVSDQDKLIAATMADSIKARLQVFITNYRTQKARNDLAYMQKLFGEAKQQYTKARKKYASMADANTDLILESYRSNIEDAENEMQLKYNIYTQVSQQLQLAQAKVQDRTPAFTVVQSASVPVKHSNTPKIFILAVCILLAYFVRMLIVAYKNRDKIVSFAE